MVSNVSQQAAVQTQRASAVVANVLVTLSRINPSIPERLQQAQAALKRFRNVMWETADNAWNRKLAKDMADLSPALSEDVANNMLLNLKAQHAEYAATHVQSVVETLRSTEVAEDFLYKADQEVLENLDQQIKKLVEAHRDLSLCAAVLKR